VTTSIFHKMPDYNGLSPAQQAALDAWWGEHDPDDYEFKDNTRLARKGNADEERAYDDARDSGCCGSVDVELPCTDGTTLLYGFNYGH